MKDKASWIVSARRTYIDALAQPFIMASSDGDRGAIIFMTSMPRLIIKFLIKTAFTGVFTQVTTVFMLLFLTVMMAVLMIIDSV